MISENRFPFSGSCLNPHAIEQARCRYKWRPQPVLVNRRVRCEGRCPPPHRLLLQPHGRGLAGVHRGELEIAEGAGAVAGDHEADLYALGVGGNIGGDRPAGPVRRPHGSSVAGPGLAWRPLLPSASARPDDELRPSADRGASARISALNTGRRSRHGAAGSTRELTVAPGQRRAGAPSAAQSAFGRRAVRGRHQIGMEGYNGRTPAVGMMSHPIKARLVGSRCVQNRRCRCQSGRMLKRDALVVSTKTGTSKLSRGSAAVAMGFIGGEHGAVCHYHGRRAIQRDTGLRTERGRDRAPAAGCRWPPARRRQSLPRGPTT